MSHSIKVVKIINEYEIVINIGCEQGVKEGDIYEVYNPGEEVRDYETDEILGFLDIVKARIRVARVYDKISICENEDRIPPSTALAATMSVVGDSLAGRRKQLNVDTSQISGGYHRGQGGVIVLGDSVKHVCKAIASESDD